MNVTIDDRETLAVIERKILLLQNPEPLLRHIGRFSRALTMKIMRERRADRAPVRGEKWEPLAESTLMAKRAAQKRGKAVNANRPLVATGKMQNDAASDSAIKISKNGMEYGIDTRSKKGFPYPGFHQIGNEKVPARRWLFWNKDEIQSILQMSIDHIDGLLKQVGSYIKGS